MSWLMATFYDRGLRATEAACLTAWRAEIIRDLAGDLLEVGAGTGLNLPHYGNAARRIVLTEPDRHMRAKLIERVRGPAGLDPGRGGRGSALPGREADERPRVEVVDASLDALPMEDNAFDAVIGTLVFCSVPDLGRALSEVFRVLRPGGRFAFLEHVAAENRPRRLRWQRRIEPLWKRLAGNCHLTRRTEDAVRAAGFGIEWVRRESMRKAAPIVRPTIRGVARKPLRASEPAAPGARRAVTARRRRAIHD